MITEGPQGVPQEQEARTMRVQAHVTRVVVAFDGSASSRAALGVAVDEAARRGTPLHLVHAVDVDAGVPLSLAMYSQTARTATDDAAAEAARVLGHERVGSTVEVGHAPTVLLATCRPGDLLVAGSHGHRPVARMLLGSTSSTLATHAPCPVLVVRGVVGTAGGPVLVGVDGSARSLDAARFAGDDAALRRVPLRAVLALPPAVDALGFVSGTDTARLDEARATLKTALEGPRADHPGLQVETHVVQGHPVDALVRHARGAQLVVVGTRGLGGLRSLVLGSVSRELLQHSPCPVVVVRGPEEAPTEVGHGEVPGVHRSHDPASV